jgi:hypothetical protein
MTEDYENDALRALDAQRHRDASVYAWLAIASHLDRLGRDVHRLVEFFGAPEGCDECGAARALGDPNEPGRHHSPACSAWS